MEYSDINPFKEIILEFGEGSMNWQPTPEYNSHYLKIQQSQMFNRLLAQGHLFVNDVIAAIDPDMILPEGQLLGWMLDGPPSDLFIWKHEKDHFEVMIQPQGFIWNKI